MGWKDAPLIEDIPKRGGWQDAPLVEDKSTPTTSERGEALLGGVNRGIAGLAGLPVDTIANILNLGIAAYGTGKQALTGKPGPDLIQAPLGGSESIASALQGSGIQTANPRPDDQTSRMLHTGGVIAGGSIVPGARPVPTAIAAAAGSVAGETLGPEWVAPATLLPGAATASYGAARAPKLKEQQTQNAQRDATAEKARESGYVIPPTQTNPSLVNRILEGFAGKITTAQLASSKNQQVTNRLARQSLGIADDAPLTDKTLADIRAEAGNAYQAIKDFGGGKLKFKTDLQFKKDIDGIGGDYDKAAKEFPNIAKNAELDALKTDLATGAISPAAAVEIIKKLRSDASVNYKAFDKPEKLALAKAQRDAAGAVESLVERQLSAAKRLDMVNDFRKARVVIARAHDVESALNETTGNVSTQILAKISNKGKPLSGGLDGAANFGNAFPKASQNVEQTGSQPGVSPLDTMAGVISGGIGHATIGTPGLALAALPFARMGTRAGIMSRPYQSAMGTPSYDPAVAPEGNLAALLRAIVAANKR